MHDPEAAAKMSNAIDKRYVDRAEVPGTIRRLVLGPAMARLASKDLMSGIANAASLDLARDVTQLQIESEGDPDVFFAKMNKFPDMQPRAIENAFKMSKDHPYLKESGLAKEIVPWTGDPTTWVDQIKSLWRTSRPIVYNPNDKFASTKWHDIRKNMSRMSHERVNSLRSMGPIDYSHRIVSLKEGGIRNALNVLSVAVMDMSVPILNKSLGFVQRLLPPFFHPQVRFSKQRAVAPASQSMHDEPVASSSGMQNVPPDRSSSGLSRDTSATSVSSNDNSVGNVFYDPDMSEEEPPVRQKKKKRRVVEDDGLLDVVASGRPLDHSFSMERFKMMVGNDQFSRLSTSSLHDRIKLNRMEFRNKFQCEHKLPLLLAESSNVIDNHFKNVSYPWLVDQETYGASKMLAAERHAKFDYLIPRGKGQLARFYTSDQGDQRRLKILQKVICLMKG